MIELLVRLCLATDPSVCHEDRRVLYVRDAVCGVNAQFELIQSLNENPGSEIKTWSCRPLMEVVQSSSR